jgi:predicted GNAT superfamily acetyltransferase
MKTFSIYRADGTKVPTLKKSFLVKEHLTCRALSKQYIVLEDGTEWRLILESKVIEDLMKQGNAFCICSYQVHEDGNYIVARLFQDKSTVDITDKDGGLWLRSPIMA